MATPIIMPRQGQSVESCIIAKWHKKKGDRVNVGDLLFSYETDKASFDEEAGVEGTLLDIFFEEGDDVPCLLNVCVIGEEGESAAEFDPRAAAAPAVAGTAATGGGAAEAPATASAADGVSDPRQNQQKPTESQNNGGGRTDGSAEAVRPITGDNAPAGAVKISPRAKNLAARAGIDYRYAAPSGPNGRIIERDVAALRDSGPVFTPSAMADRSGSEAAAAVPGTGLGGRITTGDLAAAAASGGVQPGEAPAVGAGTGAAGGTEPLYEEVKLSNIRKVIARSMHQSLSTMAQLTLNTTFDASDMLAFRKKLKDNKDRLGLENITINDIILYAVSRTLLNHRAMNAHFLDDRILYFKNVNLGVAVDTERGLMVPTIFNANLKSLNEISAEAKKLADECKSGKISPDLLKNGTFTVTNLGTLDIESFTPVINPPQTGILGVDNIVRRARETDEGCEFYPAMGLSLTFDHRAVDGAPAARFLKELKTNLENFSIMLAK